MRIRLGPEIGRSPFSRRIYRYHYLILRRRIGAKRPKEEEIVVYKSRADLMKVKYVFRGGLVKIFF